MTEFPSVLLKISLVLFMVGNLLNMGLRLKLQEALGGLRNIRFVAQSALWGFVLCPGLAFLLTKIIPLAQPYAVGMILLGMVPCAPFLPMMTEKARGDMGYTAAIMLLASVGTVVYMPLAVPIMIKGLTADAWTIARPLVFFVLTPLAAGMAIRRASTEFAFMISPLARKITNIATIVMLVLCVAIYSKGFIGAVGSYAFGTQILFFALVTIGSCKLSFGLTPVQKSALVLGMSTRNVGAAIAPLFAIADLDQRAVVMLAIGVPMQVAASLLAARWFARRAQGGAS